MSSRSKKRKRTAPSEAQLEKSKLLERETKTSEDLLQEEQAGRPSRNRRKSAKLAEAEKNVKTPPPEPQRLNVLSLHHEKSSKKDSGDLWTITSAKPKRNSSQKVEEESQLLHVVNKGKRQQTIKIKPLPKPELEEKGERVSEKPAASRSSKKSRQKVPPPITIREDASASTKEEGIKLKLILSPKDKSISEPEASSSSENKKTPSREKSGRLSSKDKEEHVKAKLVFGGQVLRVDGDKVSVGQSKKRKREDTPDKASDRDTPDSSKGNKRRKIPQPDDPKTSKEKSGQGSKSTPKVESSSDVTTKSSAKSSPKTPSKSEQPKNESKSKTKSKTPDESNKQSSDSSKEKDKKKKSKVDKTAAKFNLLSPSESIEDLVIDESPKKDKSAKKKKSSSDSSSPHRSKKHKSKEKSKAKFINTGIKKSGRNIGLDPVTASHMFGQFDNTALSQQVSLDLKSASVPSLDDESFFMAGSDITGLSFSSDDANFMGLSGLGSFGGHGKMKKKSSKRSDKDRKKKLKKMLKKEAKGKGSANKEKKPLSAYMLWCRYTRRSVVARHPDLDFSGISKMMGTLWQQLPDKEKLAWQSKQRQQSIKHKNVPSLSKQKLRRSGSSSGAGSRGTSRSPARHFPVRTEPIDCAAHLKLLGESLMLVGDRLQNHVGQVEVHGSLSVLLDSTLCALAPLISLTRQVPQLNSISKESIGSTLDNIAYIMPGIG